MLKGDDSGADSFSWLRLLYGDETGEGVDTGGGYIAKPSFCSTSNRNLHILADGGVQERDFLMSNWGSVCSDNLLKLKLVVLIIHSCFNRGHGG